MSSVQEVKDQMIGVKNQQTALVDLNNQSKVSIWNKLLFIVAFCAVDLRRYFTEHRKYVDYRLANQKSGTLAWYRSKALEFQYGFDLIKDSDKFINGNASEEEIEASKIIKYATSNLGEKRGTVVIKVATEINSKLSPVSPGQKTSLVQYFEEIKWSGREIVIVNHIADKLFLNMRIYRDPLVIDENGVSIRNANKPIEEALQQFMKELPFNGELILQNLVDKIQAIEGVKIAHLAEAKSSALNPNGNDHGVPSVIEVKRIPVSGYFEIETFDNISYVV